MLFSFSGIARAQAHSFAGVSKVHVFSAHPAVLDGHAAESRAAISSIPHLRDTRITQPSLQRLFNHFGITNIKTCVRDTAIQGLPNALRGKKMPPLRRSLAAKVRAIDPLLAKVITDPALAVAVFMGHGEAYFYPFEGDLTPGRSGFGAAQRD